MKKYPGGCGTQSTPFTDSTRVATTSEDAPALPPGRDLVLGAGAEAWDCIEIAANSAHQGGPKKKLRRKLLMGENWGVSVQDGANASHVYVLGGKRPPAGGGVTVGGTLAAAGDAGAGTGTGVVMEGAAAVAVAAGAAAGVVALASVGGFAVIAVGVAGYYVYKKSTAKTVYFVRIGLRPYLNDGETGRFMLEIPTGDLDGGKTVEELAFQALELYDGWGEVKGD